MSILFKSLGNAEYTGVVVPVWVPDIGQIHLGGIIIIIKKNYLC